MQHFNPSQAFVDTTLFGKVTEMSGAIRGTSRNRIGSIAKVEVRLQSGRL